MEAGSSLVVLPRYPLIERCQIMADSDARAIEDSSAFSATMTRIDAQITALAKQQLEIDIHLQSRLDAQDKIEKNHEKRKSQLSELSKEIATCHTCVNQLIEELSCLQDPNTRAEQWRPLFWQALRISELQKNNRALTERVISPITRDSMKFCKAMVREVATRNKEKKKKKSPNELSLEVSQIIASRESQIKHLHSSAVSSSVLALDLEASTTIEKLQEQSAESADVEDLTKAFKELNIDGRKQELMYDPYFEKFKGEKLELHRDFRMGTRGVKLVYRDIYNPMIQEMRLVAKGLQKIERDINELKAKILIHGKLPTEKERATDLAFYSNSLVHLTSNLATAKKKLDAIDSPGQVPAGVHYSASLYSWIQDLKEKLDDYVQMAQVLTDIVTLDNRYFRSLDRNELASTRIQQLFETCRYLPKFALPDPSSPFSFYISENVRALRNTVGRWGHESVTLDEAEKKIVTNLLTKKSFPLLDEEIDHFTALVTKKITNYFYLSAPSSPSDPEFDLLLHICETAHSRAFEKVLVRDPLFRTHFDTYKQAVGYQQDAALLSCFSELFQLVEQSQSDNLEVDFLLFGKYRQLLTELPVSHSHRAEALFTIVEERMAAFKTNESIADIDKAFQKNGALPPADPRSHYPLLFCAIFSKNSAARENAVNCIRGMLSSEPNTLLLGNPLVKLLLQESILSSFEREEKLEQSEILILIALIEDYLKEDATRKRWHALHDIGFMETALLRAYNSINRETTTKIKEIMDQYRDPSHFLHWKEFIEYYFEFQKQMKATKPDPQACQQNFKNANNVRSTYNITVSQTKGMTGYQNLLPIFEFCEAQMGRELIKLQFSK